MYFLERTIIVSEYFGSPLSTITTKHLNEHNHIKIFYQILCGLNEIQMHDFVNHNLEPGHILIDNDYNIKLFNYGLHYMTNSGKYVAFPIG